LKARPRIVCSACSISPVAATLFNMPTHNALLPQYGATDTAMTTTALTADSAATTEDVPNNNNEHINSTTTTLGTLTDPLVRKLSEGVGTLTHVQFHLSPEAMASNVDRLHTLPSAGTATIPSEVANMTKNLIGGGVLSLSGGIAIFANSPQQVWPSALLYIFGLGAVFGYFCLLIGKSCQMSLSATYRECWERTVGHRGGLWVAVLNTLDPLLGIFANASILAQSLQFILEGFFNWKLTVVESLLLITVVALLPLCLMKNLDALAPYSALGMAAVLTALACMILRYVDGSYIPGGQYYNDIEPDYQPQFGHLAQPWSVAALPFVCMVFTSNDMHYNASRFYAELKQASIPRFAQVTVYSFGLTAAIYFSIAIVGFMTFGGNCSSYILNNYSPRDPLATVSRIAIGLCSVVSYPLNFIGVRDNCLDILGITDEIDTDVKLHTVTVILLSMMTLTSCFVTDLGLINSVGGGTTVIFVCFLFPAIMFREGKRKQGAVGDAEVTFVMVLMVVGVVVGVVGVGTSMILA